MGGGGRMAILSREGRVTRIATCVSMFFIFIFAAAGPTLAQPGIGSSSPTVTVVDLGTLGGSVPAFGISTFGSMATDINDFNQVVGISATASGVLHAVLWQSPGLTPPPITDLGTLGGTGTFFGTSNFGSEAYGLNGLIQVVGVSAISSGAFHAFLWQNGVMTDLGTFPGGTYSEADAINETGAIVGGGNTASGAFHAFLLQTGVMTDLGTLGGTFSIPSSVNDRGQVVGLSTTASGTVHAFLWQKGVMTDLGTLGGTAIYLGNPNFGSLAHDINIAGIVVGVSATPSGLLHAFLWQRGVMTDLGTLGGTYSEAYGISPQLCVTGVSKTSSGAPHAFVWNMRVGMLDLGTLGGAFSGAFAINNAGFMAGSSTTSSGATHAAWWFVPPQLTERLC